MGKKRIITKAETDTSTENVGSSAPVPKKGAKQQVINGIANIAHLPDLSRGVF